MHIDKWDTLVWRRHRWRGERPDEPGINLREHSGYLKSSRGQTWILENDLRGGNRTGFQIRPQRDSNERPVGPVVVAYNRAQGYGWNNGHTPETYDGGSALTIWTNPDDMTFVFRNEITDAKYGCLMVGAQPPEKNWLNERGFAIGEVFIAENRLENLQGDRGAFEVTGVERLHMYANEVQTRLRSMVDGGSTAMVYGRERLDSTKQDWLNDPFIHMMKGPLELGYCPALKRWGCMWSDGR